jgi:integration host factor subunit alpha
LTPMESNTSIIKSRHSRRIKHCTDDSREKKVNKNDIGKAIHDIHGGMSYIDAVKLVDLILATIKQRLVRGEKVVISGFGCFRVVTRKDKRGVNPQTGAEIVISGRRAVTFKPSKYLKSL